MRDFKRLQSDPPGKKEKIIIKVCDDSNLYCILAGVSG